jgi:ABC-type enterochelin transport system ATPase subunit
MKHTPIVILGDKFILFTHINDFCHFDIYSIICLNDGIHLISVQMLKSSLDSKTTREVMDILKVCVKEFNQTLVMITYNDEIAKTADRIITIADGKIVEANS